MMGEKFIGIKNTAVLLLMVLLLTACSSKTTWQEQYDLGIEYLTSGDYEAAIVAFAAAIEIDPKMAEAYISLADVYIAQNDYEMAEAVLNQGLEATDNDQNIADKLTALLKDNAEIENDEEIVNSEESEIIEYDYYQEDDSLNAYGATEFTLRSNYQEFEEFSESEQLLIENMAAAAISGEADIYDLRELIENTGYLNAYSFWGEYKISIYRADPEVTTNYACEIILRPESGDGYYFWVNSDYYNSEDYSYSTEEYTHFTYNFRFITCLCEDWQWNGSVLDEIYDYHYTTYADGTTEDQISSTITTGNVENSLYNGTFNSEKYEKITWLNVDRTTNSYSVYQDGKLVEKDGQIKEGSDIYSVGFSSTEPSLNKLYW